MDYFHRKYTGLRYKVDYLVIDYKQRYYSNHRDPRIVQGKLGESPFISLRTFPHDKYLARIGEFLTLTRRGKEVEAQKDEVEEEEEQSCEIESAESADMTECLISSPIMYHPRSVSLPEELTKYSSEEANNTEEPKTNIIQRLYKNYHPEVLIPKLKSPMLPKTPKSAKSVKSITKFSFTPTDVPLPASRGDILSKGATRPEVWKLVLNDISLHAARIPYGAPPKSRQDYTNLTSDFISKANNNKQKIVPVVEQQENVNYTIDTISYQYNENDVFTLNYQDGKTKYLSCKLTQDDYDLLYDYDSYNI